MLFRALLLGVSLFAISNPALAAPPVCNGTSEGTIVYNKDHQTMQFCNGTDWIAMSGGFGGGGGADNLGDHIATQVLRSDTHNTDDLGTTAIRWKDGWFAGTVTGGTFEGSGASLTALNATQLTTGTVPTARLGSGTANATTYLRGDGSWATISSGLPALTSANIWVGNGTNVATAVTMSGDATLSNSGVLTIGSNAVGSAEITNASIALADLSATGTADGTTYLRGDNTWSTVPPGADNLGNHTATSNVILGSNWLSGDGGNEGIRIDAAGRILSGTGTAYQTDGTITPQIQFHGTTATAASISSIAWANNSGSPGSIVLSKSRGAAVGTNAALQNGDVTGQVLFNGDNGAGFSRAAQIESRIDGTTISSTSMPSALYFMTSATGSVSPATRMVINSLGNVGVAAAAPDTRLHVNGTLKIADGAELCNAVAHEGAIRYVAATDLFQMCRNSATGWESIGTGSGALPALTSANIWVGNGTNVATAVTMTGDATLSNAGVLSLGTGVVTTLEILDSTIASADIAADTIAAVDIATGGVATAEILDGTITGTDIAATTITGANIANTTITVGKLSATGTASATTYLRGDGSWQTVPAGADDLGAGGTTVGTLYSNSATGYGYVGGQSGTTGAYQRFDGSPAASAGRIYTNLLGTWEYVMHPDYFGPYATNLNDLGTSSVRWADGFFAGNVSAAAYLHTSDERMKKDIVDIEDPMALINGLRGVHYKWKENEKPAYGLIAQEVEKVMPDAVDTDDQGMKSVEYDQVIGPLIEAVKAQQKQIEALKAEIDVLKSKGQE